ncbi:MAG: hypothetical protein ACJ0G3_03195 [Dehalococcoidia bacterium]
MTYEEIIVSIVRILGALPVLKFAFFGSIFAVIIDLSDLFIIGNLKLGGVRNYQDLDKILDLAYMITFLIISLRWSGIEKKVSIILFSFRIIGMILFEITGSRIILFSFPNVFEFWIIGISYLKLRNKNKVISKNSLYYVLIITFVLKMLQEWILHWNRFLDNYAMGDILSVIKDIFTFL